MSIGLIIALIVLCLGVFAVAFTVSVYNGLVTGRNRYQNSFAQIDVQLKRRYDLIPNLVETAKGYLQHERETLEAVIQARNSAFDASKRAAAAPGEEAAMGGLVAAEATLTGSLGRFMALSESYPDLKADASMRALTEELTSTENRIAFARQAYNDTVMLFNVAREKFPANLVAASFNFHRAALLEFVAERLAEAPKVSFSR